MFLKSSKFQPRYYYKIYFYKKEYLRNIYFTSRHVTSCYFTLTLRNLTLQQEEEGEISVLIATVDTLLNMICDGAQKCDEREIQNYEPLILIKQMEEALQDIGKLWKHKEEETAIQKMENTIKGLRLAYESSNNVGYTNLLSLVEEVKENMAALKKVGNKEGCVPPKKNETAF